MTNAVRVGVDTGGTFTDLVAIRDGRVAVEKVPSTPDDPESAVLRALDRLAAGEGREAGGADGPETGDVEFFAHGTTVATNAILEGTWADAALVTTEGFRDALEIGRQNRPDIYDLRATKPDPVIPRDRRFEVAERLDERGSVVEPLDEADVRAVAERIAGKADSRGDAAGVEAVAVSLLFAFENDAHERRVAEILRDAGVEVPLSLSADVRPEIREYERTLTTAINAALVPVMAGYLDRLVAGLDARGVPADPGVMQSGGGLGTVEEARERPVTTALSGPAAGVQGAAHVAGLAGEPDVITMDVGGTSCDASLITDGDPRVSSDVAVGDYELGVPAVDIHTVGSGGGSIAWLDAGDALRVGPRSAGADPGPACYGRGGEHPTTTDAHLVLGRLSPETMGSDGVAGDEAAARRAIAEHVADPLGRSVEAAAADIVRVSNATVERALRVVTVERGHDPRDFALVAYGGAGPLQACAVADALDVSTVLVPRHAGVLSAVGLLTSDVLCERTTSRVRPWAEVDAATVRETFSDLEAAATARLAAADVPERRRRLERRVSLRYAGQSFSLDVPLPDATGDGSGLDDDLLAETVDRFHARHERRYGHASPDEPVELVRVGVRGRGLIDPPELRPGGTGSPDDAVLGSRAVVFGGERRETTVFDRERLSAGHEFAGPAVVEGPASTLVVHPGQRARVDEHGTVAVEVSP